MLINCRRLSGFSEAGGTARAIRRESLPVSSRAVVMHPRPIINRQHGNIEQNALIASYRFNLDVPMYS